MLRYLWKKLGSPPLNHNIFFIFVSRVIKWYESNDNMGLSWCPLTESGQISLKNLRSPPETIYILDPWVMGHHMTYRIWPLKRHHDFQKLEIIKYFIFKLTWTEGWNEIFWSPVVRCLFVCLPVCPLVCKLSKFFTLEPLGQI